MDFVVNKAVEKLSADVVNIFVNTFDAVLTYLQQHCAGLHSGPKGILLVLSAFSPKYSVLLCLVLPSGRRRVLHLKSAAELIRQQLMHSMIMPSEKRSSGAKVGPD